MPISSSSRLRQTIPLRIILGYPKIIDKPKFAEENEAIRTVTDIEYLATEAHELFYHAHNILIYTLIISHHN